MMVFVGVFINNILNKQVDQTKHTVVVDFLFKLDWLDFGITIH